MNPFAAPVLNGVSDDLRFPYFVYVYDVALTANQAKSDQVQINADADFRLFGITLNFNTGAFTVRFNRSGLYFLSNAPLHSANLTSDMASPTPVLPPLLFPAGSRIGLDLLDLSGAGNTIQIAFLGNKILGGR